MFFKGSRYAKVATAELTAGDGRVIQYKMTRFIAPITAVATHAVQQGDRLDLVAHQYYRDPERFWRICDANVVVWPVTLEERIGDTILIPTSRG